jgi:hypothetical protein
MGDAGKRGETRPGGGQVGRTLALVHRNAQRAAAGGKSTDDVTVDPAVYPRNDRLSCKNASVTVFHGRFVSRT